ncbi:MAG: metal ABC transporter ATP-binding protein [Patescibacteria group bacterium]
MTPCIEADNLSFSYNGSPALREVTFSIPQGDFVGLIGPNGGGKTTLLKILLGLLTPTTGTVRIFGESPRDRHAAGIIGYVPQRVATEAQFFPASVEEIVRSGRTRMVGLLDRWKKKDDDAVAHALAITDIASLRRRLISDLSGGERQRVFIARALAGNPKLLILDEPTVGVDIAAREKFAKFLDELNTKYGLTIVLVSHDIEAIARQVQHVLCLNCSLVCHLCSDDFTPETYHEKIYGKDAAHLRHDH